MAEPYKPKGYNSVSPYLIVRDAAATIAFLEQALGGRLLRSFPDDEGKMIHAEVLLDDTVVMIADSAPDWPPLESQVHVYVPDVDAAFNRALAAGADIVQEPAPANDDDKRGGVRDGGGTTWWLTTRYSANID